MNETTTPKFNGYMARIKGDKGEYVAKVINSGVSASGEALLKVRERMYNGCTGNFRVVSRYEPAIWIKASRVIKTWPK